MRKLKIIGLLLILFMSNKIIAQEAENQNIQLIVKFTVKQSYREDFLRAAEKSYYLSLKEEGNMWMYLSIDFKNPNIIYVVSLWKDKKALDVHNAYPYSIEIKNLAKKALVIPPEIKQIHINSPTTISLQKQWELDGFSMPESVFAEPNSDWLYVSNYNGNNAGFISRVSKSGKIDQLHWVDGVDNPTGMAKFNGKLYVVNHNEVVRINPQTATIEKRIKATGNVNLNDITVTPNGTFYVGNFTGGFYTFKTNDNEMTMWLNAPELATPNGIMIDGNELITGTIGARMSHNLKPEELGSVYRINLKTKKIHLIKSTEHLGSFDGLIKYKNGYLATTNSDGKTHFIVGENTTEINQPRQGKITDFGLIEDNMYAPYMFENKLVKYKIIRK